MFEDNAQGVAGPGTVVGANVKLTGTISDVNDITVHGTVEGEVVSDKTVTIAETAAVKGPVTAQMVSISGTINGAVTGHQKVELLPTGKVNGSIATKDLIIKSGASFNGKCAMSESGEPVSTDKSARKEKAPEASEKSEPAKAEAMPEKLPEKAPETVPAGPTFELEE